MSRMSYTCGRIREITDELSISLPLLGKKAMLVFSLSLLLSSSSLFVSSLFLFRLQNV
jgi:hypothetical protein